MSYPSPGLFDDAQELMDLHLQHLWHEGYVLNVNYWQKDFNQGGELIARHHKRTTELQKRDVITQVQRMKYLRAAAKTWKRPLIRFHYSNYSDIAHPSMSIWMPMVKYLNPLRAPLALMQGKFVTRVTRYANCTTYVIYGDDIILDYLRVLRQPEMRAAMKIPAHVQPLPYTY